MPKKRSTTVFAARGAERRRRHNHSPVGNARAHLREPEVDRQQHEDAPDSDDSDDHDILSGNETPEPRKLGLRKLHSETHIVNCTVD